MPGDGEEDDLMYQEPSKMRLVAVKPETREEDRYETGEE